MTIKCCKWTDKWYDVSRGGGQGDYREGMQGKIDNVVGCLSTHSHSKRAIIPIPFNSEGSENVDWTDAAQTKCCRELHLYPLRLMRPKKSLDCCT